MDTPNQLTILGLGSVGAAAAGRIRSLLPESAGIRIKAIDTDARKLAASGIPDADKLQIASNWRQGRGCGGNVLDGQRALAFDRAKIETLIGRPEFLLVTAAFGGGTATGGAGIIQSICRKNNIPVIFLVTLPFTQEGHSRRQAAEDTIRQDLLSGADAVLALPNDLLYSVLPPTTPVLEAYDMANQEFARTAYGIALLLTQNNLLAPDTADLAAMLHRKKSFCSIGIGQGTGENGTDRCLKALEEMLQSPLLGGADKLAKADAVIFSLIGGSTLSLGEVRQTLDTAIEYLGSSTAVLSGASVEPSFGDRVMMCAIAVNFDDQEEMNAVAEHPAVPQEKKVRSSRSRSGKHSDENQQVFAFENPSKGIMERTTPVIWNGEDLDDPTWRRRSASLDQGSIITAEAAK